MAKGIEFYTNYNGVGKLLRCATMQTALNSLAARIQPDTKYIHGEQGNTRYHVLIHTNDPDETLKRFYSEASN